MSAQNMHTAILPSNITVKDIDKEIYVTDSEGHVYKNVEAVAKIAEEHFKVKHLVFISRIPLLKQALSFGYRFVALNRHYFTGDIKILFWTKIITILGLLSGLLISAPLWLDQRLYPLFPFFSFVKNLNEYISYSLFGLILVLLCATLIFPKPQKIIWLSISMFLFLIMLDQSRMQPWVIQYLFILGLLGTFSWQKSDSFAQHNTINSIKIIIAGIYFYSGLQKINTTFVFEIMPWLLEPLTKHLPSIIPFTPILGIMAPFIQIFFAIGLLTQKYRKASLILAVLMHLFILLVIGPFGHNWNAVVWPWTTAMIAFDIILFSKQSNFTLKNMFTLTKIKSGHIILGFFIVLPLLSFFNHWDSYLSSALYAGNTTTAEIEMNKETKNKLPPQIQAHTSRLSENTYILLPLNWSISEMRVPPYPETRIYKAVARKVCTVTNNQNDITLTIQEKRLFNSQAKQVYTCSQLK